MNNTDPLYKQVKSHLTTLIEQNRHNPYYMLPSETSLAQTFKASRSPIQKALRELSKEGLIYKIRGKGTFIYNDQQQVNSLTVYLVVPHIASHFLLDIVKGVHDYFKDKNVHLLITITDDCQQTEQEKLEYIMKQNFSGMLLYPIITETYHDALFKLLLNNCQVVLIGHDLPRLNFSNVHCDYYKQLFRMTTHLLDKGHRHIAFVTESGKHNFVYQLRAQGYRDSITGTLNGSYIHLLEIDIMSEDTESINKLLNQFFEQNDELTAVITMSKVAENVCKLLQRAGKALTIATIDEPENALLTERDDIILLDQMPYQIGWKAAEQLYNQIVSSAPVREIIVEDRIVEKAAQE